MNELSRLLAACPLPQVAEVWQSFPDNPPLSVEQEVGVRLAALHLPITHGMRIAITCGSRAIDQYASLVKSIVSFVKSRGGSPFLIPSMGSHGGATAEGQTRILHHYGITEAFCGAPILSSMDVVQIGATSRGLPVYIDKNAYEADGIILLNRVKPHTSFRGNYESGLMKMLAIGLANQHGAEMTHFLRYENMAENILDVGRIGLEKLPVLCGVCTIENAYGKIAGLYAMQKEDILSKEPEYLKIARSLMPRLPLEEIDCLIVFEAGKDISGTGMDTNIIGRYHSSAAYGGPNVIKLGLLNITKQSDGNANGIGLADFIPRHLYGQIDFEKTYMNTLTSTEPNSSKIPMVLLNDREVFQACVKLCGQVHPQDIRMAVIQSTKHLDRLYLSQAAVRQASAIIHRGDMFDVPFDSQGNLLLFH